MVLAVLILRDAFYDEAQRWVRGEWYWGLLAIIGLLATPAIAEPVKKLTSAVAPGAARQKTN
jgi:hypothetical protein